jgi:hypothetical protein
MQCCSTALARLGFCLLAACNATSDASRERKIADRVGDGRRVQGIVHVSMDRKMDHFLGLPSLFSFCSWSMDEGEGIRKQLLLLHGACSRTEPNANKVQSLGL